MIFDFGYRDSDAPLVDLIWRTQTDSAPAETFMSQAGTRWEMVITREEGKLTLSIRGPETQASPAPIPENAEFFGIAFKLGTFMPHIPINNIVDSAVHLPEIRKNTFWLNGSAWQFPTFENADVFVERLVKSDLLVHEPLVQAAMSGELPDLSLRSVQRRFLRATGLTHATIRQIERAQQAVTLLQGGTSILDTVYELGYADQPHLTRALKRFMGQTPAQLLAVREVAER